MSKLSDLGYYMQRLASEIEDIEDIESRNNVLREFSNVEHLISDIENDLDNIKYCVNHLA